MKIGSLGNLASASGSLITHLDLTRSTGAKSLDFKAMAKQLPNLKGLAVSIYVSMAYVAVFPVLRDTNNN